MKNGASGQRGRRRTRTTHVGGGRKPVEDYGIMQSDEPNWSQCGGKLTVRRYRYRYLRGVTAYDVPPSG
jgi:hypothetical protein